MTPAPGEISEITNLRLYKIKDSYLKGAKTAEQLQFSIQNKIYSPCNKRGFRSDVMYGGLVDNDGKKSVFV